MTVAALSWHAGDTIGNFWCLLFLVPFVVVGSSLRAIQQVMWFDRDGAVSCNSSAEAVLQCTMPSLLALGGVSYETVYNI